MSIETPTITGPILSLQVLRGAAAVLVVLFHSTITLDAVAGLTFLGGFFRFGNSGVEIFFVLSGFIISYTTRKSIGSGAVGTYLTKRFTRIYPIYWITICVFLIPAYLFGLNSAYEFRAGPIVSTFLLLPGHPMIDGVSWSLSYELYFYLLFALLILDRRFVALLLLVLATTIFGLFLSMPSEILSGFVFSQFVLLFFMGVAVDRLIRRGHRSPSPMVCVCGMICSALAYLVFAQLAHGSAPSVLFYGAATALFIFFCVSYERSKGFKIPKIFLLVGDASYVLYLLHLPLINGAVKVITRVTRDPLGMQVLTLILVIIIIALSIAVHLMVEKPANRWLQRHLTFKYAATS